MLPLTPLRLLTLREPEAPGRLPHVAAASGLVGVGESLYVVADDALHLARFGLHGDAPGESLPLLPGTLPLEVRARKALKPDLEALCLVPLPPHGALLALPSGSTPVRRRGALLPLTPTGLSAGAARAVDCTGLYAAVERALGAGLNVEGAALAGEWLWLLQRGNGVQGVDALVALSARGLPAALASGVLGEELLAEVRRVELGTAGGVRLSFTDASPLPDGRLVFTAAAEASPDAYADGVVAGSAVGVLSAQGEVLRLEPVDLPLKLEGVHAQVHGARVRLLLTADADDPERAAPLLSAEL